MEIWCGGGGGGLLGGDFSRWWGMSKFSAGEGGLPPFPSAWKTLG